MAIHIPYNAPREWHDAGVEVQRRRSTDLQVFRQSSAQGRTISAGKKLERTK
jgi:hypothetical protein